MNSSNIRYLSERRRATRRTVPAHRLRQTPVVAVRVLSYQRRSRYRTIAETVTYIVLWLLIAICIAVPAAVIALIVHVLAGR